VVTLDKNGQPILSMWENPDSPHYDPNHQQTMEQMMEEVRANQAQQEVERKERAAARHREKKLFPRIVHRLDDPTAKMFGLSAHDVAYELQITGDAVRKLIRDGELTATKRRGAYVIRPDAVRELVKADPDRFPKRRTPV